MATEKAYLEIEGGERIPCLFNPTELQLQKANEWAADSMPGKGVSRLRYAGAQSGQLSLSLFFDTTAEGKAVTSHTGKIVKLMDIDPNLPGADKKSNNARPPWVRFHWGDLHSFKAVVSQLDLSFVFFSPKGVPLRAKLDLVLT